MQITEIIYRRNNHCNLFEIAVIIGWNEFRDSLIIYRKGGGIYERT